MSAVCIFLISRHDHKIGVAVASVTGVEKKYVMETTQGSAWRN
jgi:hypothetical protein